MHTNSAPQLTVIYPLVDVRGCAAARLRSWTHRQSLHASQYRVIVASDGKDATQDREAKRVLRPGDEWIVVPGGGDGDLWNAGAARSTTPWLVFTEGHCEADSGCLAAVSQWIAVNPGSVIGNCTIDHDDSYLGARLADRWFKAVQASWQAPDTWPRLHRSGFAIRADVFSGVGGFEPAYGQFSVPLLSAHLHAAGLAIDVVPEARVLHWDDERMRDHHYDTADFVCGEFAARFRNDPVFVARYFGDCPAWRNQLRFEPTMARTVLRALLAAAAAYPSQAVTLLGLMRPWASAVAMGPAARGALRRLATKLDEFVVERIPLPWDRRYAYFVSAHARTVRTTQLECIQRRIGQPQASAAAQWSIERLDPTTLIGLHGLERHDGRPFRWSEPVILMRGVPQNGACELRIETGAIRGDPLPYVIAVVAGGRVLPRACLATGTHGRLAVRLQADWAAAARDGLVLIVSPLIPSRHGSPDRRRLGLPILSIASAPLIGDAQHAEGVA